MKDLEEDLKLNRNYYENNCFDRLRGLDKSIEKHTHGYRKYHEKQ